MNSNHPAPTRFDFSHTELVGHLDLVGECFCRIMRGEPVPYEVVVSCMTVLRSVRDDIAAKDNLPIAPIFRTPAYLAECEIRNLVTQGIFDRNEPISDEEGA
jgi:hypothetical protein